MLSDKVCRSNTPIHEQLCGCAHLCMHARTRENQTVVFYINKPFHHNLPSALCHTPTHAMGLCGQFTARPQECSCTPTTPRVDTHIHRRCGLPLLYCPQLERFRKLTCTRSLGRKPWRMDLMWGGKPQCWVNCDNDRRNTSWLLVLRGDTDLKQCYLRHSV